MLWIILVGFVAGVVARLLSPGPNRPVGFLLTTALGIAGAFMATFVGQTVGWYRADQGAGFIGAIVGAVAVLSIWNRALGSTYGFLQGAWPFRVVEAIWAVVAVRRWRTAQPER
jgi:uncharacterized membrane protein YeaQ/YmgE (transglycosylase-associated protein family)